MLKQAVDIYRSCDFCLRGHGVYPTGEKRQIIGDPDSMTDVMICEKCKDRLKEE